MNARASLAFLALLCAFEMMRACEPDQRLTGCKLHGNSCICGHGCKTEYSYRNRKSCMNALRERNDVCFRNPCMGGICIQTILDPGFSCKCEGTGFYGQRCEKACPTIPLRGLLLPHECIVI